MSETWKTECLVAGDLALELTWRGEVLAGTHILLAAGHKTTPQGHSGAHAGLREAFARYAAGEKTEFSGLPIPWEELPGFTGRVLRTLHEEVGFGRVVSYGRLAAMVGSPRAARAVGQVMARNRWPLVVPCHRVLGSDGSMTGFSGQGGVGLKEHLLRLEGALPAGN
ncbi:methylated-DNA--[protein]-cysteine S-methyltransferase [Desulfocurvus sp. DL9XJH121]